MTSERSASTLGVVLTQLGPGARLLTGEETALARPVRGASVWTQSPEPADPGVVLICPPLNDAAALTAFADRLPDSPARMIVLTSPCPVPPTELVVLVREHLVVEAGGTVDPADVVLAIARSVEAPEESVTRRLSSLQRSLTQVLGDPDPVPALLNRLKTTCNAAVALVDKRGQAVHATGPIPLALLFGEITQTSAETQRIDIDGWHGVADRIGEPDEPSQHFGWLVVTARRTDFPDSYITSAVHVAASLVEASLRMTLLARQQERAVRATVLEEALALERKPQSPELTGRIASFGLSFTEELRAIVLRPVLSAMTSGGRLPLKEIAAGLGRALEDAGIARLASTRDKFLVMVVQCSPSTFRRILVSAGSALPAAHVGVGRRIQAVGEIADSYDDAQLAVQMLVRRMRGPRLMSYEEFDFATRLFSDVGTDRMTAWARRFLRPLAGRQPLLEGLRAYFENSLNMNAASEVLSIHHNSLRYRLAKVEELLDINLREPAALSSVYLALAAVELERVHAPQPGVNGPARPRQPSDVEAPRSPREHISPHVQNLGVVLGPDR
jgi:hypothetical protein